MHGLIFVTWEKFLAERFKGPIISQYRATLEGKVPPALLTSRVYNDDLLLTAVGAASEASNVSVDKLLKDYGRFFITNGLTRHSCAYILTQVHSARELLLAMHDSHEQMTRLPESLTPPLFQYETHSRKLNELVLIYNSPRKLCSVLAGAIEGAAERYGEKVQVVERTCMKRGDAVCRFEMQFSASPSGATETPEQVERQKEKLRFAHFILALLPESGGLTLMELQKLVAMRGVKQEWTRPALLLEALRHLHHAGLVATTANQTGDDLAHRRYWRASTSSVQQLPVPHGKLN